ncbi:MAG: hypothetical protein ACJAUD_000574 [Crocinitomicaceae bacterium]|jgi:uncharacterized protein YgiM (DUF1202 family)
MKKSAFIILSIVFISFGCDKEKERMEVIKDCTGVYLRTKNGQDYKVCNDELLENVNGGTKIKVTYDNLDECFGILEPPTCSETHTFEGKIEITEIF